MARAHYTHYLLIVCSAWYSCIEVLQSCYEHGILKTYSAIHLVDATATLRDLMALGLRSGCPWRCNIP